LELPKEMGRFKVNERGELVDITMISFDQLQKLLDYYETKLKRARSRDMRIAYEQCVRQIRNFMVDNRVEDGMDIFSLAYYMGLSDLRSMIKTYFGRLETEEEMAKNVVKRYFEKRREIYSGCDLPSDRIIKEIFKLLEIEKLEKLQLSNIQKAANIFSDAYGIRRPQVKMEPYSPDERTLFYNIDEKTSYLYLDRVNESLALLGFMITGLFEHLCENRSWKFHSDPLKSFELQRQETERYTERFFDRCTAMGLLRRKVD
jgi:hypothetical protein